jgi:hypothetical protein
MIIVAAIAKMTDSTLYIARADRRHSAGSGPGSEQTEREGLGRRAIMMRQADRRHARAVSSIGGWMHGEGPVLCARVQPVCTLLGAGARSVVCSDVPECSCERLSFFSLSRCKQYRPGLKCKP